MRPAVLPIRLPTSVLTAVILSVWLALLVLTPEARADESAEPPPPGEQAAELAVSHVGAPYVWGGSSPYYGFDCTGFVQWVYRQLGVELPRSEAGQLAGGEPVGAEELQPGDVLVFANTYRRGLSHTGIYLGDGQFVHAVDEWRGVAVSDLWSPYWAPRLVGASRPMA